MGHNFDGLVQERHNSRALKMELRLPYINPLIWYDYVKNVLMFILEVIIIEECHDSLNNKVLNGK